MNVIVGVACRPFRPSARLGTINEPQGRLVDARRCHERALRLAEQIESEVEIRVTRHTLDALGR